MLALFKEKLARTYNLPKVGWRQSVRQLVVALEAAVVVGACQCGDSWACANNSYGEHLHFRFVNLRYTKLLGTV